MPLLGDIFGAADAFKRSLADLMRNPLASAQQRLGLLGDQAGAANRDINLLADQNALRMQGSVMADAPMYRQAEDASRQRMFNALMNFAPVGMMIGPKAKTWDAGAAAKALEMEKAGTDPRVIWKETGVWKGPDGNWRQEIPDNAASLAVGNGIKQMQGPLDSMYSHDALFRSYPELRGLDADISVNGGLSRGAYGNAYVDGTLMGGSLMAKGPTNEKLKSTTGHEVQHAIQEAEGWARGGSSAMSFQHPEAWKIYQEKLHGMRQPLSMEDYAKQAWGSSSITQEIANAYKDYKKQIMKAITPELDRAAQESAAKEYYRRLAGEAEARATQARMNMDAAQRRATFPADSYDVPINQLIFK